MKNKIAIKSRTLRAFTLVELLTVIAIIGILAAMLLTVLPRIIGTAKEKQAKMEMGSIVTAIEAYDQDNSRYPITAAEQAAAGTSDFTTGLVFPPASLPNPPSYPSYDNNSNVVAILMDLQNFPNGNATVNFGHVYNPKQVKYLNAKMVSDATLPGVGPDLVYRDPWGNPYVITMDLSYDDQCSDILYSLKSVSQNGNNSAAGYNGLSNPVDANGSGDHFYYHGKVMVWSAGPDKKYDTNPANTGVNKDNVLSWQ